MGVLKAEYGIDPPEDEPEVAANVWLHGRKGIKLCVEDGFTNLQAPNTDDGSACFVLGQRIVARGRILLLEMMAPSRRPGSGSD